VRRNDILAVRASHLSKHYRSPWTLKVTRGLDDLDLEVRAGEVMGYIGPNGAGKTTTLKLLTGLHKPTRGNAWIFGVPVEQIESRRRLGFLPEQPYFFDYLTGLETLEMAGRLSGLPGREADARARRWLGRVGISDAANRRVRKYSKGMLQRLGLAAALLHEPDLLILDEPMSGLDPMGRREVRDLLLEQRARGVTVLFSSHILPDVETLCDRVAIVVEGRLQRIARVGELVAGAARRVDIHCASRAVIEIPPALREVVGRVERGGETVLVLEDEERLQETLAWLVRAKVTVRSVTPQGSSLEEIYVRTARARGVSGDGVHRRSA
jgi:ABC-2 type transport system ATP-binding protein